jgi:hypothetical protein
LHWGRKGKAVEQKWQARQKAKGLPVQKAYLSFEKFFLQIDFRKLPEVRNSFFLTY